MSLESLRGIHSGQTGYVVGKGPSLAYLTPVHFGPGPDPVLALNDVIVIIQALGLANPLYSLQKDGDPRFMVKPNADVMLILQSTRGYSGKWFPEHPRRFLTDPKHELGFKRSSVMSLRMSAAILRLMSCDEIVFLCCDAFVTGDLRTYDTRTREIADLDLGAMYAAVIPLLQKDLRNYPHKFVVPEKDTENG